MVQATSGGGRARQARQVQQHRHHQHACRSHRRQYCSEQCRVVVVCTVNREYYARSSELFSTGKGQKDGCSKGVFVPQIRENDQEKPYPTFHADHDGPKFVSRNSTGKRLSRNYTIHCTIRRFLSPVHFIFIPTDACGRLSFSLHERRESGTEKNKRTENLSCRCSIDFSSALFRFLRTRDDWCCKY